MTLELVIPEAEGKEESVKDCIFTILAEGESRTLTQLQRELKKRYKKSVSFQAILKAVRVLLNSRVLTKEKKLYTLNKEWIFEIRNYLDRIYTEHFKVAKPLKKIEMGTDVTVYTVSNLLELDRLWNDLLVTWAKNETENKINVCKGNHCWWLLPRLQEEDILHDLMLKQKIITYNLITDNTSLDKQAANYYKSKGEHVKIKSEKNKDDRYLAAFGQYILRFEIPQSITKELEPLYQKAKKPEDLDLKRAADLFKRIVLIEVILIKDRAIAKNFQEQIINQFKH